MFKFHIILAVRNLAKHKLFSIINGIGLSVGMAAGIWFLLTFFYFRSFDSFYQGGDRVKMIWEEIHSYDTVGQAVFTPEPLAAFVRENVPEIEYASTVRVNWNGNFSTQRNKAFMKDVALVDSPFFDIVTPRFVYGNDSGMGDSAHVVLTEKWADFFFGDEDPIGDTIYWGHTCLTVCGVVEDAPENSVLRYSMLISQKTAEFERKASWVDGNYMTIARLRDGVVDADVEESMNSAILPMFVDEVCKEFKITKKELADYEWFVRFKIVDISDVFMDMDFRLGSAIPNKLILYCIGLLVGCVLFLSCVNYVNLSSSHTIQRYREIACRKLMGASKKHVALQILVESFVLCLLSGFLALVLLECVAPFVTLQDYQVAVVDVLQPANALYVLLFIGCVGFFSGIYPALALAILSILELVRGRFRMSPSQRIMKRFLVVSQLIVTTLLAVYTTLFNKQYNFMVSYDYGVNINSVIEIENLWDLRGNYANFKKKMLHHPGINHACCFANSTFACTDEWRLHVEGAPESSLHHILVIPTDTAVFDMFDIDMVCGDFSLLANGSREKKLVLNEAAMRLCNFDSSYVGKYVDEPERMQIAGFAKDFHFLALRYPIYPQAFLFGDSARFGTLCLRIAPEMQEETMEYVKKTLDEFLPWQAFVDSDCTVKFADQYRYEKQIRKNLFLITVIAMVLSAMGVLGLTLHGASVRTKEIGVRKVYGASSLQIVALLLRETTLLLCIAVAISLPLAYWVVEETFDIFSVRVNYSLFDFLWPFMAVALFLYLAEGAISLCIANKKPSESLRYE